MKESIFAVSILALLVGAAGSARADIVYLSPTTADIGQTNNGINFTETGSLPATFAYVGVGNASYSTYVTAVQFDLSSLQGSTITSATLSYANDGYVAYTPGNSSFTVSISGYTGTGEMGVFNFSATTLFTAGAFPESFTSSTDSAALTPISQDATSFVQSEVQNGALYAGFLLTPTDVVTSNENFTAFFNDATLTVDFTAVPEPSSIALLAIAVTAGAVGRLWKGRNRAQDCQMPRQ